MKTETPLWHQSTLDIPLNDLRQELGEAKWNSTFAHSHLYHAATLFHPEDSEPHDDQTGDSYRHTSDRNAANSATGSAANSIASNIGAQDTSGASSSNTSNRHCFVLAVPNTFIRNKILTRHIADLQRVIARHIHQSEENINLEVRVADERVEGECLEAVTESTEFRESAREASFAVASFDPALLSDIDLAVREQFPSNGEVGNGQMARTTAQTASRSTSSSWGEPRTSPPHTDPRFTFDNFVSGSTNRFAYQATLAVAETPGTAYNPLFIFGNVGLGKTHLLQASAHFVKTHYPEKTMRYMATETFLNDFLMAIRNKQSEQFRQRYRKLDVLILDDIQILEGKEALQEELFHTFNHMYDQNKQLIFSSDRPPDALLTLQDRLRSRFKSGLLTDIQPPSIEVRLAILEQNVEQHNARRDRNTQPPIVIPEDALMFIAENFTENIRELEGALTKVIAHAQLLRIPPSYDSAKEILGDLIGHNNSANLTAHDIIQIATNFFSLPKEELLGPCRTKDLVTARHITMYALREHTDLSLPIIGGLFDGRDHTSVLHAVNKITEKMKTDNSIHSQVLRLTNHITRGKVPA